MTQPRRTKSRAGNVESREPVRYSIPPGFSSELHVKMLPRAVCTLRREQDSDDTGGLRVLADDEGIVRLHAQPSITHSEIARMVIDAEADGKRLRVPLHLRPTAKRNRDMPHPRPISRKPQREGARIRPALAEH